MKFVLAHLALAALFIGYLVWQLAFVFKALAK